MSFIFYIDFYCLIIYALKNKHRTLAMDQLWQHLIQIAETLEIYVFIGNVKF